MHILGTAGHVDHGKSSLVRALTGTDPDRFVEERLRGMTLDLGFAHLRYEDGLEAGIVDVPGHERFLHNMLAGAAGMDVLLLVVAANEGPKPQTFEHLAILEYLNVRRTIVVLTKADLVDAEELGLVRELVADALHGTFAEAAESIAVSTTTGEGLDTLRAAIEAALRALPEREPNAPAYLPIDRVFALAGHGTIVTGTLMQGRVALGDELMLAPAGKKIRVRNLHVFGERRPSAGGGTRVAINVPAIDTRDAKRGDVLASSQFASATTIGVAFRAHAPALALLKRKTPVRAYLGSAELFGTLVFERIPAADETVAATLRLRTPSIVVPGSAYVVRSMSPKTLLGGGTIGSETRGIANDPEDPERAAAAIEDGPEIKAILTALRDAGIGGAEVSRLGGLANLRVERAGAILTSLEEEGRAIRVRRPDAFVDAAIATDLFERVRARLAQSHEEEPWVLGLTSLALARSLGAVEARLVRVLGAFVEDGGLAYRNGYYAEPGFVPRLTAEQRAVLSALFAGDGDASNVPAANEAVRIAIRNARVPGVAAAFETLLTSGAYIRIGDAVYRSDQIERMKALLIAHLRAEKQITVSTFRELAGISRKFAVPLMEWFDANGVTVRSGDVRFIRTRQPVS